MALIHRHDRKKRRPGVLQSRRMGFERLETRRVLDSTVVFNEIMYHGADDQDGLEWVELHNQLAVDMDISRWRLDGGTRHSFAEGTIIPGGGYLVVASDPAVLALQSDFSGALGPLVGQLSNAGEVIHLLNNNDRVMDTLDYDDTGDWPVGPDGSGFTLAKRNALKASQFPANWITSASRGGTPGEENFPAPPEPTNLALIVEGDPARVLVPSDASLGLSWTQTTFDDSSWTAGPTGIGYESSGNSAVAYGNLTGADGSFESSGPFGHDFVVNSPIAVTHLGVFDSSANGLSRTLTSELWSRHGNSGVKLAALEFTTDEPGTLIDSNRLKLLDVPLALDAGDYTVVAHGYGTGEPAGHQGFGSPSSALKTLNDGGGAISFVGTGRVGSTPGTFPTSPDIGTVNYYSAGTFQFATGIVSGKVATEIESEMFEVNTSAYIRIPFTVDEVEAVQSLTLTMEYSDGLVAYVNGGEVTRRNAPLSVDWNSAAATDTGEFVVEVIDLDASISQLQTGTNVLALHGLNAMVDDPKFLILPELDVDTLSPSMLPPHPVPLALNEIAPGGLNGFFLEIANDSALSQTVDDFVIASSAGPQYVLPAQSIAPGGYLSLTESELGFAPADGDNLFLFDPGKEQVVDARRVTGRLRGRSPEHDGRWLYPDAATPGAANTFNIESDLVINEILYHPFGQQPDHIDTNSMDIPQTEWVELYNRGTSAVGLSGWKISGGVEFTFAADTTMQPDSYLVVAADALQLAADYPNIDIVGNFSGRLSNRDEFVALVDNNNNPVDEVHYYQDGYWPRLADGGGSSLELRNPFADNTKAEAWAASEEASKSTWNRYVYRDIAGPTDSGLPYHELVIGLLDAGELLLDDLTVVADPNGAARQLIQNNTFESDTIGSEADKWRIIGNHFDTVVTDPEDPTNRVLHLVASGRTDDIHNHAETTLKDGDAFVSIVPGEEYEISFRAKWLGGSNQFNTRLYYTRVARTTLLPVPQQSGTPGAMNSRFESNIGPTFAGFIHAPAVPAANEPVTVTAVAKDLDGVRSATVHWSGGGAAWQNAPMVMGSDGRLIGTIPGHPAATTVQFYIDATDGLGASSMFPAAGLDSRALFQVQDGQSNLGPRHNLRIIQTTTDANFAHQDINVFSNHRLGSTLVLNESQVFYDVGVRLVGKGSRHDFQSGYSVRFHAANKFLGVHRTIAIDHQFLEEMLLLRLNNHAGGIPGLYNDAMWLIGPTDATTGIAMLRLGGFGEVYLDGQFTNGNDFMLFEKEMTYRATQTDDGTPEGRKLNNPTQHTFEGNTDIGDTFYGTDKEAYRPFWLVKNNRERDDYSSIIELNEAFRLSGTQLDAAAHEVIDVDQWMRVLAMTRLAGIRDWYSMPASGVGRGSWNHNFFVYQRPSDQRLIMLPWDMDRYPHSTNQDIIGNHQAKIAELIQLPGNLRQFYGHLNDLMNRSYNAQYTKDWASHFAQMFPGFNFASKRNFIIERGNFVLSQLPSEIPFSMTTTGPFDAGDASTATLRGEGWINVRNIRLAGREQPLEITWTAGAGADYAQIWETEIELQSGTDIYEFEAYDFQGVLIDTSSIQITTSAGNPVIDSLRVTEINYNPADPTSAEFALNPTLENDDFEFITVQNIGTQTINLQNVTISDGVDYVFPAVDLSPGQRGVVVGNESAFELRYGTGLNVLGEFAGGKLSNAGENLSLVLGGQTILDFSYGDDDPWPEGADGTGQSLVLIDPAGTPTQDYGDFERWRGTTEWGGSPAADPMSPIGVVINEVFTNTELPQVDAIELHNTTGAAIDMSGWWLSDDADNLSKFQIPATTMVPAGGYVVFDESHFNPNPSSPGPHDFALNSSDGDQVWLVDLNAGGTQPDFFVDNLVFGGTFVGETLGRSPNGSGRLDPMMFNTIGSANSGPRVGPLVISEVMYNPPGPGGGVDPSLLEFVEFYNPTAQTVDLADWELNGVGFSFSADTTIGPGQTMVVVPFDPVTDTTAVANFEMAYNVSLAAGLAQYVGPYAGGLDGGGERLTLLRADDLPQGTSTIPLVIEDHVDYNDTAPWPTSADGDGDSLHRRLSNLWAGDATSWVSGIPSPGSYGPIQTYSLSVPETVMAEVGQVTTLTDAPQVISLSQTFNNPVVFAQPASIAGQDPVVVRVTDVQADQFTIFLAEPSNLNGLHGAEETASYIVFEAGSYWLADGTHVEVGAVPTSETVGKVVHSPQWKSVDFASTFSTAPLVMSQLQSMNSVAGEVFLATRQTGITSTGFQVALEQEESITAQHVVETVGFVAMEPVAGVWSGKVFEAAVTPANFSEVFSELNFGQTFPTAPNFIASLASYLGSDNAHLRYQNLGNTSVELKIEEDMTRDPETTHTAESVGYLAIGGQGSLSAVSTQLANGGTGVFTIEVVDTGRISDVNVLLNVVHTRSSDLDVFLESPDGTIVELLSGVGGESDNFTNTVFDDEAANMITSGAGPFTGLFQPAGYLADFDGREVGGTWALHVTDSLANGDRGVLIDWSLLFDLAPDLAGNVNHDSDVDSEDIDLLFANLGSTDLTYDLDGDGDIDRTDANYLILDLLGTRPGDTDVDFDIDINDFNSVVSNFDPTAPSAFDSWATGNFDGDNDVDISDVLQLVRNFAPLGLTASPLLTGKGIAASAATRPSTAGNAGTMALETSSSDSASSRMSPIQQTGRHRMPWRTDGRGRVADSGGITDGVFQQQLDWQSYDTFELTGKRNRRTLEGTLVVRRSL